ncbi:MAG: CTP synthase [Candidatus Edwardsbacteria bacterium]|nr:CTP synthase [Candidatus Edwardsbacteria bacterium]MBU1577582.1 CTP synthase [Candidatus Edwardsbacteria bacterium]MBU2463403.1 CTP synthase [Candidatus Edwardsbacteria bacterium]MBU2593586.1 CTP synthase [Candidatus Edwardsbacteria bacterium]
MKKKVKFIFVTGGVVSSLGKGIASASLGYLLKARGLKVNIQKFDPYLNVDPGTMSPFQHGEVFVTDDGAETDLDLGHYERFIDRPLTRDNNLTSGQIYESIITKERRGDYLGKTVQVVPHVTNEIKARIHKLAESGDVDVLITEIGGTVGDIESLPFIEAIRQFRLDVGRENCAYIHLTLVPYIRASGELKTKPTQHSVNKLREIGIQPDIIICRTEQPLDKELKEKIGLFCNVSAESVIEAIDVESIYEVVLRFHNDGLDEIVAHLLGAGFHKPDLTAWSEMIEKQKNPESEVRVAICGKYVDLHDAYKSIIESFVHAGIANRVKVKLDWIDTESLAQENLAQRFDDCHGILVCPGFGERGIEGKILAARYAREKKVPYFGICLGLQVATIEFARNVCGMKNAHSTEFDDKTPHPVIDYLPEQRNISNMGGTMRLGAYPCVITPDTKAHQAYQAEQISERHRHRYEVNNTYVSKLEEKGLVFCGRSPDGLLVEMVELKDHPWFIGCQFHPEFKSRPMKPQPLFRDFVKAAKEYRDGKK